MSTFILLFFLLLSLPVIAGEGLNVSVFGTIITSDNLGTMWGGGTDLSYMLTPLLAADLSGYYTVHQEKLVVGTTGVNLDSRLLVLMPGINVYIPVSSLNDKRIRWKTSIYAGYTWIKATADASTGSADAGGQGMMIQPGTGIEYIYNQHLVPFVDIKWFGSYFNKGDFADRNISGFQFNAGLKYSFSNTHSLNDEY